MEDKREVLVPIWVLKQKVETDFEEFMFLHNYDKEKERDVENTEEFPLYDSTMKILEILENGGVKFDKVTGLWK